ncbi:hypothetical protein E1212_07185 [Jiangella ureilytica]|uniref:Heme peroxidase n=1 Tax=Jiangella ureilytica TaxID=2530374 RepID=A0A4R4RSJ7_9ACTN|nr:hypothetical protein [Jiangella ureilytica]TDC52920.1 hypothetical protein E1212_07185 [Jiangella ureilytica]
MANDDVQTLVAVVRTELPGDGPAWPGGWPDQIEAALIDAVRSIRAAYGREHNGVRGAVGQWRAHRGSDRTDDLTVLAETDPAVLTGIVGKQRLSGGASKAEAIVEAARNLSKLGVRHAADVDPDSTGQKLAYTDVVGLGDVTWEHFLMLLGRQGVKADVWINRFVHRALRRTPSSAESRDLVKAAAAELRVDATAIDYAIWSHARIGMVER